MATVAQSRTRRGGCGPVAIVVVGGALLLLAMLAIMSGGVDEIPNIEDVRLRPHAVERHGQDALDARAIMLTCKDPRFVICPRKGDRDARVNRWCADGGGNLCYGMYTTRAGSEATSLLQPCVNWVKCK